MANGQQSQRPQAANRNAAPSQPAAATQTRSSPKPEAGSEEANALLFQAILNKEQKFTPLGEDDEITLTPWLVMEFIAIPTKKGYKPTVQDCTKFTMMCRQRKLNPFAGDAYMVGYDTQDGPKFSVITAIQAMFSRAEQNKAYDGVESGVIVQYTEDGVRKFEERQGDLLYDGEDLLGGWCKVHRSDRKYPSYQRLKLSSYNKGTPQWRQDAAGMICKCAEAAALRQAFPTVNGGLYLRDEIEAFTAGVGDKKPHPAAGGPYTLESMTTPAAPTTGKLPTGASAASTGEPSSMGPIGSNGDDPFAGPGTEPAVEINREVGSGEGSDAQCSVEGEVVTEGGDNDKSGNQEASNENTFNEADWLAEWQFDIEKTKTNGELDALADDMTKIVEQHLRAKVAKMVSDQRARLRTGNKKPQQPPLPGTK